MHQIPISSFSTAQDFSTTPASNMTVTISHQDPAAPSTAIETSSSQDQDQLQVRTHHRPLYFAYGSNLSPTQMRSRCLYNPQLSGTPVAIARLDAWRWLICQYGYANVIPPAGLRIGKQVDGGEDVPISGEENTVYGVLYEMDARDEELLDGHEGVDPRSPESKRGGKNEIPVEVRPREQKGLYNKWYVDAAVTEWIDEKQRDKRQDDIRVENGREMVPVLVYVDEERVCLGPPRAEYIPRMNRAIREAKSLGLPGQWAEEVMRKSIPLN